MSLKISTFLHSILSTVAVLTLACLGLLFTWPYLPLTSVTPSFQSDTVSTTPRLNLYQFHTSKELEDLSTAGDASWQQLTTTNDGGFLWVRHNETYRTGWGISMFHSLHCLGLLREIVKTKSDHSNSDSHHASHADAAHAGHCLSYIAQSLLCSADGTLERPKSILDENGDILRDDINGEGVEHRCRDHSLLWKLARRTEQQPIGVMPPAKSGDTVWDWFS
ncbi:uncharacterized protein N7500_007472 [Penicillium coprophilum]|uniref:uncharacterized protein n=1 Tax=Penicillium coprophilum TaxID=36646 RepID=UPI00239EEB4C|nr:uncharacterized protein N7500_007472 [Penicillium coprophilum]KAJ5165642.1 hypothetical protein N7500_007472 [Penicillium coprophilum]